MKRRFLSFAVITVALTGCDDSTKDQIKKESEHFEFLIINDGSKQEKCASMKRLRDLNAEAKDERFCREWSKWIEKDC